MRLTGKQTIIWIALMLLMPAALTYAQQNTRKPARILFLLDGSSSMLNNWTRDEDRFSAAGRIIQQITDSVYQVNPKVAFALRVYGTQYPAQDKNCYDTELEVPFGYKNAGQIQTRLKYLKARGYSPIAWSLEQAAIHDFTQSDQFAYSIILLTDGGESCGGDICQTVEKLLQQKISFQPYILSLVDYAPLQQQYDCLGKFLTVAQETEIGPAIQAIINDNRIVLQNGSEKSPVLAQAAPPATSPVAATKPVLSGPISSSRRPARLKFNLPLSAVRTVSKNDLALTLHIPPEAESLVLPAAPVMRKIATKTKPSRMRLLYAMAVAEPRPFPKQAPLRIPPEEENPTPTVTMSASPPVNVNPARPAVRKVEPVKSELTIHSLVTEQANDTRLQVIFTNGKGKFYNAEPKMEFIDVASRNTVKTAYRNMMGGHPDPILLPAGTYDIFIPGSKATAKNVTVQPNKLNTITIVVGGGSIAFHYPTNPNRPVKEYTALISKRFDGGPVVKQPCDTELPYDPTNYHIEINTLPPLVYNVDVEFNEVKLIAIPEAGTVEIVNTELMGKIQFWWQMGDAFVPFYDMVINGNQADQTVMFRPGHYQVRYYQHGSVPSSKPSVISFSVKSNQTTKVKLIP